MVDLIALLESTENGNGVLLVGLIHQYLLETPFQGSILLHVLSVLIECGGPNAMEFAPGQGRLEHVARIHGALGFTRTHHGVQFIDEQNDPPLLLGQLI